MRVLYKKETLQDPQKEGQMYTSYTLVSKTEFCCDRFKEYCKKFTGWSYDYGKFSIVNEITYDGHSVTTIDFCPFCGKKIEYEDKDLPKKVRNKK